MVDFWALKASLRERLPIEFLNGIKMSMILQKSRIKKVANKNYFDFMLSQASARAKLCFCARAHQFRLGLLLAAQTGTTLAVSKISRIFVKKKNWGSKFVCK